MSNTYWSERTFLRPAFMSDDVWQDIFDNFADTAVDNISDTAESFASSVSDFLRRRFNLTKPRRPLREQQIYHHKQALHTS